MHCNLNFSQSEREPPRDKFIKIAVFPGVLEITTQDPKILSRSM